MLSLEAILNIVRTLNTHGVRYVLIGGAAMRLQGGAHLQGLSVRVASIDDLIAMKRAANRPKDQAHVLELLALKKLKQQSSS